MVIHPLRVSSTLAVFLFSILLGACDSDRQLTAQATYDSGQRLYRSLCAGCHGADGHGDGPVAAQLLTQPADLTRISQRRGGHFPDEEIHRIIDGRWDRAAHGPSDMPIWGKQLFFSADPNDTVARAQTESRIEWLVAYLRSIQQR